MRGFVYFTRVYDEDDVAESLKSATLEITNFSARHVYSYTNVLENFVFIGARFDFEYRVYGSSAA